ncbi:hypothetical protein CY35_06G042900, partial [Sphagnum magellanicum]
MPLMIGFSKNFLCYFHLGSIWICLLPPFLFERSFQNDFEDGSLVLTLMCGIHFCLALGMTFNSWNNLQNIATLPTLLPLILFCTSIETE